MSDVVRYERPPIHEVVLTVNFASTVAADLLPALEMLDIPGVELPLSRRVDGTTVQFAAGANGLPIGTVAARPLGFTRFDANPPTRLLHALEGQFSYHTVRAQRWPTGVYRGWEATASQFDAVLAALRPTYGGAAVTRPSLRYLNRLALPSDTDLVTWLQIGAYAPPGAVRDLAAFEIRQSWSAVEGHPGLAANLGLSQIEIDEPTLRDGHIGLLLDIEVTTLSAAPPLAYDALQAWFSQAHRAERLLFEACITDALRHTLGPIYAISLDSASR